MENDTFQNYLSVVIRKSTTILKISPGRFLGRGETGPQSDAHVDAALAEHRGGHDGRPG